MLALGIGSYQAALFYLITHAYLKALLFLGSGSVIHSMEPLVGYSPDKSQNMVLMGGLTAFYMFRIYLLTFDGYFSTKEGSDSDMIFLPLF
ncbi:hypothetical protein ACJX0J_007917, partial [Zea mays]